MKILVLFILSASLMQGAELKMPVVVDQNLQLTLVAREPAIVTPVGIAVDQRNRIFVMESHTHFPPKDYKGPKTDLIKVFDLNSPGHSVVFADGIKFGMNLLFE